MAERTIRKRRPKTVIEKVNDAPQAGPAFMVGHKWQNNGHKFSLDHINESNGLGAMYRNIYFRTAENTVYACFLSDNRIKGPNTEAQINSNMVIEIGKIFLHNEISTASPVLEIVAFTNEICRPLNRNGIEFWTKKRRSSVKYTKIIAEFEAQSKSNLLRTKQT